ncbi:MAG: hypothetical protein SFW09_05020 [Hyphomicrobiaceae bacterium]|nr:hypothetical protein [Hyphomicrobiaceae bacterium]
MNSMWRTAVLAAVTLGTMCFEASGQPAAKELSDKSVKVLMDYAWAVLPSKFTMPDRRVIEVDKKTKKAETLVPLEVAREVIKVGYHSAQAQLCEMWEEQTKNFDAMIHIQRAKSNWTDQQLLYITTLHRMTIHMAAGKLKVTEKDGEQIVTLEPIEPSKATCNDEKRKKVKEIVAANVAAASAIPRKAGTAPAPGKAVVPASQKQ